jgi:hypothetical protein
LTLCKGSNKGLKWSNADIYIGSKCSDPDTIKLEKRSQSKSCPGLPDGIHIFKPKIAIWLNIVGSWQGRYWYLLWSFGLPDGIHIFKPKIAIWVNIVGSCQGRY